MSVVAATRTIPRVETPGDWYVTPYGWQFVPKKKPGLPWWAIAAIVLVLLLLAAGAYGAIARTAAENERTQQTEQRYDQYRDCIVNSRNC